MMRFRWLPACVLALAVAGCDDDGVLGQIIVPLASVHWVNAVPDTGEMDYRVVDIATNAGMFDAVFRETEMVADPIEAGDRAIRVFMSSTDPAIASTIVVDTTIVFTENSAQTFIHMGFTGAGRSPSDVVLVLPETPPTPGAGQIAIRVFNAAPSLAGATPAPADTTAASDVYIRKLADVTNTASADVTVPFGQVSSYVTVDTGQYWIGLRATGSTGPVYAQVPVPPGTGGSASENPIAGSQVAGSVLTMVLLPRSVVGTAAPQEGTPDSLETDTTAAEAVRRVTRSGDTVTAQSGSISQLVNRPDTVVTDTIVEDGDTSIVVHTVSQDDSTVATTGTGEGTGVTAGDVVFVSGAAEPEYNGWQVVIAEADSLSCAPTDPADTAEECAAENAIATTRFRFRYRIVGTPASPATGTVIYRLYPPETADYTLPGAIFLMDRRPPNTSN